MAEGTGSVRREEDEPGINVRSISDTQEMHVGVSLQQKIWGYSEIDTVPQQMFVVAKESGGQVLFAFDGENPIGFALAYAGFHRGKSYLHSHMVGVVPGYQDRGVGRLLKLAQRDDAIARGIDLIEWTFDPLQLKNAYFNLSRLGAIVRKYIPNFYGRTSSPLHAGLPTDRLVAEWWLQSEHVKGLLNGVPSSSSPSSVRISIPISIRELRSTDPAAAEKTQTDLRNRFQSEIADGRAAVGFVFDQQFGSYLLESYED